MRITSDGRLGIGTTTPQNRLVVSNGGAAGLEIVPATDISQFNYNRSTSAWVNVNYYANQQVFGYNGTSEGMRITSSGNVGIGTTSPNSVLTSQTSTTSTSVFSFASQLNNSYGSNDSIVALGFHNRADANSSGVGAAIALSGGGVSAGSGNLVFCIKGTGNIATTVAPSDEKMRITSGGVVLVGTTTAPLYGKFQAYASADNNASFVADGGFNPILVWNKGTSNQPFIEFGSGASYVARGSITTNGTTTSYNTSSDYRLKENIAPMIGALNVVQSLKPVTYTWKADGSSGQGFIAHELQDIVPDCVTVVV
jgi:hypothetical protein